MGPEIVRQKALDLLARREHSATELRRKLLSRGYATDTITQVLAALAAAGLQDDARFAEAYTGSRIAKGYGPQRIARELEQRGVAEHLAAAALEEAQVDWAAQAQALQLKKFGKAPGGLKELAQQSRFLTQRGFTSEQVRRACHSDF